MAVVVPLLPSVHIRDTLVADGFAFASQPTADWMLWIGKEPEIPDRCITIYDTPGRSPNPRWLLDFPSVQVRIRGGENDYNVAGPKTTEIRNRLVGRRSYDAYGTNSDGSRDRIVMINQVGDISFIGWDANKRPAFVINLALTIEPSPTTSPTDREPL